ncbi:MAG: DUF1566 domain-containing protein [Nanoarchaeota archaeon]|nr:DUF1566 domain-containing protein [Nanoarchaeota archaeon]
MQNKDNSNSLNFLWIILIILVVFLLIFLIQNKTFTGKITENEQKIKILEDCGENTSIYYSGELCWEKYQMPKTADNWTDADNYCNNLILANHTNWKLPTLDEFKSIKKYMLTNSSLYRERFFWTSTPMKNKDKLHAYINFGPEYYYWNYAGDFKSNYGVKCVRKNLEILY